MLSVIAVALLEGAAAAHAQSPRGLPQATARGLLIYAFAREMVDRVALPALRDRLGRLVAARLPGGDAILEAA